MNLHEIQTCGVNLKTGDAAKLRPRYVSGTDHAEFNAVFDRTWYRLASFSMHVRENIPPGQYLLIDRMSRYLQVDKNRVAIGGRI